MMYGTNTAGENFSRRSLRIPSIQYGRNPRIKDVCCVAVRDGYPGISIGAMQLPTSWSCPRPGYLPDERSALRCEVGGR